MLRRQLKMVNDDLEFTLGRLTILSPEESLPQRVKTRLQTFLGEVFANESLGVPYFQQIFAEKNPRVSVLNGAFVQAILSVDGVARVSRLDFDLKTDRQLEVILSVIGEDGAAFSTTFQAGV
jgi:hypothetical protein